MAAIFVNGCHRSGGYRADKTQLSLLCQSSNFAARQEKVVRTSFCDFLMVLPRRLFFDIS